MIPPAATAVTDASLHESPEEPPVLVIAGVRGSTLCVRPDGLLVRGQAEMSGPSRLWRYDQLDRVRLDAYGSIGVIRATLRSPDGDLPLLLLEPDQITAARRGLEIVWNLMATQAGLRGVA